MAQQTQPDSDAATRDTDQEFLDLVCADEELLRAEFDEIIANGWPSPPTGPPTRRPRGPATSPGPTAFPGPPRGAIKPRTPPPAPTVGPAALTPAAPRTGRPRCAQDKKGR